MIIIVKNNKVLFWTVSKS